MPWIQFNSVECFASLWERTKTHTQKINTKPFATLCSSANMKIAVVSLWLNNEISSCTYVSIWWRTVLCEWNLFHPLIFLWYAVRLQIRRISLRVHCRLLSQTTCDCAMRACDEIDCCATTAPYQYNVIDYDSVSNAALLWIVIKITNQTTNEMEQRLNWFVQRWVGKHQQRLCSHTRRADAHWHIEWSNTKRG